MILLRCHDCKSDVGTASGNLDRRIHCRSCNRYHAEWWYIRVDMDKWPTAARKGSSNVGASNEVVALTCAWDAHCAGQPDDWHRRSVRSSPTAWEHFEAGFLAAQRHFATRLAEAEAKVAALVEHRPVYCEGDESINGVVDFMGGSWGVEMAEHAGGFATKAQAMDFYLERMRGSGGDPGTGYKFNVGDRVQKVGGSYWAAGTIKAAFRADDGSARYVFRFDVPPGLLRIFNENQLEALASGGNS